MQNSEQQINFNYTDSVVEILNKIGITLLMSTYQSGKIMIFGGSNSQFDIRYKNFPRPMGMTFHKNRLYAGLGHSIYTFANFSSVAKNLEGGYDGCYLPQNIEITGDIDIHEMEYIEDKLYFINTKFSSLCIKDKDTSFKPIWKPPFISLMQPVDKCHLNGFCSRDNRARYITALGKTDEPMGWRANKIDGGILMDIESNEILLDRLSMPHSPRWHNENLYFLESGKGSISRYDFQSKKAVELITLPGFTRGFDIVGDIAFVGLSKVRESATFSGLPITKLEKRVSGVWIVDLKNSKILGFIEFTTGIDEVFAILALPHSKLELFNFDSKHSIANYMISPEDIESVKMPETPIESATPYFERAQELFNEGKKVEALTQYQRALDIQPDFLPATFNRAICLGDLGRFEEAETLLNEVKEKDASILEIYDSLAYLNYKRGDFKKAKENYEKVLNLDPENQKAKISLGILEQEEKKRFKSDENLEFKFVYKNLTNIQREEVVRFWLRESFLPREEAIARAKEVSLLIYLKGDIIGLTTIYPKYYSELESNYFYSRMAISAKHRGSHKLVTKMMVDNFSKLKSNQEDVAGLMLELENRKFQRLAKKGYMKKRGYTYLKESERGLALWYVDFKNPTGIFLKN